MKYTSKLLLILFCLSIVIRAQDQFIKLLCPDMYLIHKHTYGLDTTYYAKYSSNNYSYQFIKSAGISHLFSTSDPTPLSQTSVNGQKMKIYDRKISEYRYDTIPYLAGLYGFGIGVSPEDHPFKAAGQYGSQLTSRDDYWGFGNSSKRSRWQIDTGNVGNDINVQGLGYFRESDTLGFMCGIRTDPEHFYLHTTGGPQTAANLPIRYYAGITAWIDEVDTLVGMDSVVLELHLKSEWYNPKQTEVIPRNFEYESVESTDTCTYAVIYLRRKDISESGFVSIVPTSAFLRHPASRERDSLFWHVVVRAKSLGNCRVKIKDMFVVDQFYKEFTFLKNSTIYSQVAASLNMIVPPDQTNYAGIYLEEPTSLMNRSISKLDSLANDSMGVRVHAMDWFRYRYDWELMRYNWSRSTLQADGYFLNDKVSSASENVPDEYISIQEAIDLRIKTPVPDRNTYYGLRANIEAANGFERPEIPRIPYINYIQIGEERRIDLENNEVVFDNREVSPAEIQMQGWLSLCFGAKGLAYYPSAHRDDTISNYRNTWSGMFKPNASNTQMVIDSIRYNAVQKLNAEIDSISSVILRLKWINSYSTASQNEYNALITQTPIQSIQTKNLNNTADADVLRFAQVSYFKHDEETDSTRYFIVMNRRVMSNESRYIRIVFDNLNTYYNTNYANWKVTDVKKDTSYTIPANGGDYTFLCPPGEGKLFKLEPVLKSGYGKIQYNETINEVVTVPSGKTLNIEKGVTLNFGKSGRFVSNGTLNINGTADSMVNVVFDSLAFNTYQTGITINYGNASIRHANISKAYYGVRVLNNAWVSIYGSKLYGNYAGVLLEDNLYSESEYSSTIDSCIIYSNTEGIYFHNGIAYLMKNRIRDNYANGILLTTGAYGNVIGVDGVGKNKILNNANGIHTEDYSIVMVGHDSYQENYNTVDSNNVDLLAQGYSTIEAAYVWWGDDRPTIEMELEPGAYINTEKHLSSAPPDARSIDPIGHDHGYASEGTVSQMRDQQATDDINTKMGFDPAVTSTPVEGSNLNKLLNEARKYFRSGNYYAGAEICKAVIDSNKNDKVSVRALNLLSAESQIHHRAEFRAYIEQLNRVPGMTKIDSYVGLIDAKLDPKKYESKIDALIAKYNKKDELLMYLYDKFVHCLLNKEKPDQAIAVYGEMVQRFPESKLTQIAYRMLNPVQFSVSQNLMSTENAQVPKEYGISNNYPNPFNPETSIDYAIPYPSNVVIELYGVTGEKVRTLVQNDHTPGYYTYRLTNTSGMASGIYFYRIAATNLQTGKVYTTVRKMTLMK